jgi:hypothetical protein
MIENIRLINRFKILGVTLGAFFSLQSSASLPLYSSPEVDISWEDTTPLPPTTLAHYQHRANELASFYRTQILPPVPARLWGERGTPPGISVRFKSDLPTDGGLFTPPFKAGSQGTTRLTLDISTSLIRSSDAERILAHEFFHALHWMNHPDEPAWLREGLAQVFETRVYKQGKFNVNNLTAGFAEISTSLQGEMRVDAISAAQYGHTLLYFWYLYQRCGGDDLFWALVDSPDGLFGTKTIEYALKHEASKKTGCKSFLESFVEFELARAINTRSLEGDDPDRWFLVASTLAKAKAETKLPDLARWARTKDWTPILVETTSDGPNIKKLPGARAYWIQAGSVPKVIEATTRPSPKYTRVLILRFPKN